MYCKGKIVDDHSGVHEVIGFGPISVLPEYQRDGIGSMLINRTINKAREMGFVAILICGNPDYYHRFGFKSASEYEITMSDGSSFDAFMALELREGALGELSGRYYEDDVFHSIDGITPTGFGGGISGKQQWTHSNGNAANALFLDAHAESVKRASKDVLRSKYIWGIRNSDKSIYNW